MPKHHCRRATRHATPKRSSLEGLRRDTRHLRRRSSSTMLWHRLFADSLHLAVSRSQRGRMEYFNGLLIAYERPPFD